MRKLPTREQWLTAALPGLKALLSKHWKDKINTKPIRVACGWCKSGRDSVIGECWPSTASAGELTEMFISPVLDEPVKVLDVLLHELIHAVVGNKEGHRGKFKTLAVAVGLKGKMTATFAETGTPLHDALKALAARLGAYPHSKLQRTGRAKRSWNKRIMYVSKTFGMAYRTKIQEAMVAQYGAPRDPNGDEMVVSSRAHH